MTTALTKTSQQPQPLTLDVWNLILALAPAAHSSRLFGVSSPEQAAMIMAKGHELGMPITAAFELIQVIQGKPTLSPRGALALVQASGLLEEMQISEQPGSCTVTMKRRWGSAYTLTWTLDDAKKAGIVKPDGAWVTYPANMLRWRAIGFVIDVLFSDVTGGLKRADEFGATIDAGGDVITVEVEADEVPAS
jgi:hypothetical protein